MDVAEQRLEVADTGNIDRDARALARSVRATLTRPAVAAAVRATLAISSPEIRAQIATGFWGSREAAVGPLIERAMERGQLPPSTDVNAVIVAIAAPLYFRLLVANQPLTVAAADTASAAALAAARAGVLTRKHRNRTRNPASFRSPPRSR
jgi:Tetracyclin repressor-like, C-terminal domain